MYFAPGPLETSPQRSRIRLRSLAANRNWDFALWRSQLRALPDLVMWQLLIAVQRRTQQGFRISPDHWDHVARHLRSTGATSLLSVDPNEFARSKSLDYCALQREARLAVQSWEDEQRKVVWDLGVIGLPGTLDFSEITQSWLAAAMQWWVAEELPRRRAKKYGVLRDHSVQWAILSATLRLHRDDDGEDPSQLGRSDILAYLTQTGR